jgi:N-acetylglucosaminyl-diphospho-decaprenol L-rhamnosyltransferase
VPAEVRVGIVSWNSEADLHRCLAALPAALGRLAAEVVVVDNASSDASAAVAEAAGAEVLRNPRNVGYAAGMNRALAGTAAPVLVALNPDTEPPPCSLERLVATLRARPDAAIVVPRLVEVDGRPQHSAYRLPSPWVSVVAAVSVAPLRRSPLGRRLLLEGAGPHRGGPVPWAIGAVHVLRAAALAGAPPYAERAFMYAEDLELCWRLGEQGWVTWLDDDVEVPHVGNASGALAWGEDRGLRYWAATYDVVAARRGAGAARRLGAGAAVAATVAATRAASRSVLGGAAARPARRAAAHRYWREARLHAVAALHGPPPAPVDPPSPR